MDQNTFKEKTQKIFSEIFDVSVNDIDVESNFDSRDKLSNSVLSISTKNQYDPKKLSNVFRNIFEENSVLSPEEYIERNIVHCIGVVVNNDENKITVELRAKPDKMSKIIKKNSHELIKKIKEAEAREDSRNLNSDQKELHSNLNDILVSYQENSEKLYINNLKDIFIFDIYPSKKGKNIYIIDTENFPSKQNLLHDFKKIITGDDPKNNTIMLNKLYLGENSDKAMRKIVSKKEQIQEILLRAC